MEIKQEEMQYTVREILYTQTEQCTIYYHSPCQDGFCAAWQVWEFLERMDPGKGKNARFIPINYGVTEVYEEEDYFERHVIFVDFCPSDKHLGKISTKAKKIFVIDHHIGAIERLQKWNNFPANIFLWMESDRLSGAGLVNEILHNPHSAIVHHVSDRDLWKFNDSKTRAFCDFLMIEEESFENWHLLNRDTVHGYDQMVREGCGCIARKFYDIQIILERDISQWSFVSPVFPELYACNIPAFFVSDAADFIRTYFGPTANFCGFQINMGRRSVYLSLRGPAARRIAEHFGGSGHDTAAGAEITLENFVSHSSFEKVKVDRKKMFAVRKELFARITT